ncbi:helix-turn-helix domain-containing protein [Streptomyces vinaceus]|uniref:helix-turn-helix domain-containing protein n=1 Tax=Streptomyces vinaceus TaxID=1960 RepID=UPI0035D82EDD
MHRRALDHGGVPSAAGHPGHGPHWRRRFIERGLDGLCDDLRPGVPRKTTDADVERVIVKTLEETPKSATHWSTRSGLAP